MVAVRTVVGCSATRGMAATLAFVAVVLAAAMGGCGDEPDFVTEPVPGIGLSIDTNTVTGSACSPFQADQTGGQLKYTKKVAIKNSAALLDGSTTSVLCLKTLKFASENKQLKMLNLSGKTSDDKKCPGAFAAIPQGKSLNFEIEYKPNADEEDLRAATLTIESNDIKTPKIVQEFCIQSVGATICVDSKEITFLNASAANPPVQCVYFSNCGSAPLTYKSAAFGTANSQYTVVDEPNAGTVLPEVGHPENPKGNLKKLKICVKYTPNSTPDDEDGKLVISTSDKSTPNATVILGAQTQEDSKRQWTCSSASGKLEFNFLGHTAGDKQAKCKVCNDGPAGYAPNSYKVEVHNPQMTTDEIAAIYKVEAFASPAGTPHNGLFSVSAGKCAEFVVTMTHPNTGLPPAGDLVVGFTQANVPGTDKIPIVVGKCDSGEFAVAPETGMWLQAASGKTAQGTIVVANQGCGPLQLINACVTTSGPVGLSPCDGSPSKYHGIVGGFSSKSIAGSALLPIKIEFHPPDANKINVNDLLHLQYCSGKWNANKCDGGSILVRTVNLVGSTDITATPPTLTISGPAAAKVGSAVKVTGVVTPGKYSDGKNNLWWITERPHGSTSATTSFAWWSANEQTTALPAQTFIPDFAGTYVIAGMTQAIDEADASHYAWSAQQTVTIVVK